MYFKHFIICCLVKHVICVDPYGVNVGTVLFTISDNTRKCWSNEQLALLRARLVYQDILPRCTSLTIGNDKFVGALVSYFRLCIDRVRDATSGKVKEINMKAVADAIGGYLHQVVIPLGKQSFYAGKISYDSARSLTNLHDEMKAYLRTDGVSWSAPIKPPKRTKRDILSLDIARMKRNSHGACNDLIYTRADNCSNDFMSIPMPFLDSKTKPTAIALPYKSYPVRNLRSQSSSYILVKYYQKATACLKEEKASDADINRFNRQFKSFLDYSILPHADDEDLYPALGSVYQLEDILEGRSPDSETSPSKHVVAPITAVTDANHAAAESSLAKPDLQASEGISSNIANANKHTTHSSMMTEEYSDEDKSMTIMFSAVGVVIVIWIITGIIYCCCRMRKRNIGQEKHTYDKNKKPPLEFVSSTCPDEKTSSHASSKQKTHRAKKSKSSTKGSKKTGNRKKSTVMQIASLSVKGFRSEPISKMDKDSHSADKSVEKSSSSNTSAEKPPAVFGYDFETSSSDSSSIGESSSSSGTTTPK